jgi:hypothetical protein
MAAVCPVAASLSSPPLGRPTLTTQRRRGLNVYQQRSLLAREVERYHSGSLGQSPSTTSQVQVKTAHTNNNP